MNNDDVKVGILNMAVFALSFSELESYLKVALLLVSIGYTANKWYKLHKEKK
jgi:hypothetical protein